jgi:probable DNA metabolism protein
MNTKLKGWKGLKKKISKNALNDLISCYLSEEADIEQAMFSYISYVFNSTENVEKNFGYEPVLKVSQTSRKVFREKHRFEAFIRFQLLKDGLFFAPAEPDFNILPLIVPHFKTRYADQKWLIFDLKRKYGIYYDLSIVSYVKVDLQTDFASGHLPDDVLHPEEHFFQLLWKDYFKSSNFTSRKNIKLHLQHMPQRYWKYLTEKK